MALQLGKDELRAAFAKLHGCLVEGLEDEQIADRLGLAWEDLADLKRRFYDHESEGLRSRSTEHSYVRYALEQRGCLNDLDKVIQDYEKQKNVSGYVGAVRAKSEIIDRIMHAGLELGLIKRMSGSGALAAGGAIKDMPNAELRAYILAELNLFNQMRERYGEQDLASIETGPLHRTAVTMKFPVKGHARSKVFGGRRVVKDEGSGSDGAP